MVHFDNNLIRLDYNPATDIMEAEYPDLHDYLLSEIKRSIDTLVETATYYDVKRLLLDSSRTVISVSEEGSRDIATYLAIGLSHTRVQKVARVQSLSSAVEVRAHSNINHLKESRLLPFQLRNFTDKSEATEWLQVSLD